MREEEEEEEEANDARNDDEYGTRITRDRARRERDARRSTAESAREI